MTVPPLFHAGCAGRGPALRHLTAEQIRAPFSPLVESVFGKTGLPWRWEYNPEGAPPPVDGKTPPRQP